MANECAPNIGYYIASVLTRLNVTLDNVELFGHSLGGSIIGYTGCALNGRIGRITGILH